MSDQTIRRRLLIGGQVQGVFFRDSTQQQARAAGVAGHVRNLDDGRVEVVLEGEPQAVQQVIEFCRAGPSRAEVRGVSVTEESPRAAPPSTSSEASRPSPPSSGGEARRSG